MIAESPFTIVNPVDKKLIFNITSFDDGSPFSTIQRLPYSSVIWITHGTATLKIDFSLYSLMAGHMLFLSPFQPFSFTDAEGIKGIMINFHPEFFCLFRHENEIAFCSVIFNNIYQSPWIIVESNEAANFQWLIEQMKVEIGKKEPGQHDLLVAMLKVFFIRASRIKMQQHAEQPSGSLFGKEPIIIQHLQDAIDRYYREKHSASDYASMLNVTPKTLGRIAKSHFNKTLTDLIAERIIVEAKRQLYMTQRTVKEIAYDLGFNDEYYFSRYFKNITNVSPISYRESIGTMEVTGKISIPLG
jgi:AraC family transcriptional regulator, transcriptional activator of pobA